MTDSEVEIEGGRESVVTEERRGERESGCVWSWFGNWIHCVKQRKVNLGSKSFVIHLSTALSHHLQTANQREEDDEAEETTT